jgi:hypothetical protein
MRRPLYRRRDSALSVLAAGRPLLEVAQRANEVRSDLALEQITDIVVAIAKIHGDSCYLKPILQAALDGLRPPSESGAA